MVRQAHTQSEPGSDRDATGRYHACTPFRAPICVEAPEAHGFGQYSNGIRHNRLEYRQGHHPGEPSTADAEQRLRDARDLALNTAMQLRHLEQPGQSDR